jgi:hypothetical protein
MKHHPPLMRKFKQPIDGLLDAAETPRDPDLSRGSTGSKKTKVDEAQGQQGELF